MTADASVFDKPSTERLIYLDGWRGWAVTFVLIGHFLPIPGINLGTMGVELFFVLSGRLMAEILFIKKVPLRTFFPRRINRVYPALLVFVVLVFIASQFTPWAVGTKPVVEALTFTLNYSPWIPGLYRHPFFDHLWSLCVEEHAYVLLALVVLAARKFGLRALPTISIIAVVSFIDLVVSTLIFGQDYFRAFWRTDTHIGAIFVATAIHLFLAQKSIRCPSWLSQVALAFGLALSATMFAYQLGTIFFAVSVCTVGTAPRWWTVVFTNPTAVMVGLYSYSIYLWQQPFYQVHSMTGFNLVACLVATALMAALSFHLIEQPARTFLNGWTARRGLIKATA